MIPQYLLSVDFHPYQPDFHQDSEPLLDWSLWEKYRSEVVHPCLTFKPENISLAKRNMEKFSWARKYVTNLERTAQHYLELTDKSTLESLIEATTPGDPLWTPCPACRDQGKPVHPHGLWTWDIQSPDQLECTECATVFPNPSYPESVILQTTWGNPQNISYYGGEPFTIFGFTQGRPSFTANIRSRKVQWCAGFARLLAEVYILTDKALYAEACKRILLRLAACYPHWLVHVGYGEYADMDPKTASLHISRLPQPELTPPPNKPDGALWTGFWSAGRASGVGLESDFIRKVVEAYDMTASARDRNGIRIYSEEECILIERDLLLESTILLVCDKKMNNKSVSNRTAVALVGMCVGHPGLFRFGLEGFYKTINEWFLPDGTTSESIFYGLMTLGGIWDFAEASKGYRDPVGYTDDSGTRIEDLNVYTQTGYDKILEAFFNGLQGDLTYPPYADSFHGLILDPAYVDLMVANYPANEQYLALLKEVCGKDLQVPSGPVNPMYFEDDMESFFLMTHELPYDLARPNSPSSFSLFFRDPDLVNLKTSRLQLQDWCPPKLRIGHMRTGADGRESLLLLSASEWGIHHERDSLHLYYWKNGVELLPDLGYLWDHPLKQNNIRTLAHNTVLIDEENQKTQGRGGTVTFFHSSPHVKVIEATSTAYDKGLLYRRTSALVDHGGGKNYAVDFFRVEGGHIRDYVLHAPGLEYATEGISFEIEEGSLYDLRSIQKAEGKQVWKARWPAGKGMVCTFWGLGSQDEKIFLARGWGQLDWKNSDVGAENIYLIRRNVGGELKTFMSVIEGSYSGENFIRSVNVIDREGIIAVETTEGTDYIGSAFGNGDSLISYSIGPVQLRGRFSVVSLLEEDIKWTMEVEAEP